MFKGYQIFLWWSVETLQDFSRQQHWEGRERKKGMKWDWWWNLFKVKNFKSIQFKSIAHNFILPFFFFKLIFHMERIRILFLGFEFNFRTCERWGYSKWRIEWKDWNEWVSKTLTFWWSSFLIFDQFDEIITNHCGSSNFINKTTTTRFDDWRETFCERNSITKTMWTREQEDESTNCCLDSDSSLFD